ncbi:hypothetical protein RQP46_005078 [Phenoliferia psychrophenolica]
MLEALAAQFRPITQIRGYGINSLEEHDWNPQFGGRNFNGGEVIEIVLRRPDGSFQPYQWLLYVMCHELAHIEQMNHSRAFQKVNQAIRGELAKLRAKGYYGDGFWSKGRTLTNGKNDTPMGEDEMPNYTCGGANKRSRKRRPRAEGATPRRAAGSAIPGKTGRQTAIPRKAGGRVTKAGAFQGEGNVLSAAPEMSTFRRQANSKSAIEARLAAAEARQQQARDLKPKIEGSSPGKGKAKASTSAEVVELSDSDSDDDDAWEDPPQQEFDEEEKEWMDEDMKNWEDDVVIIEGPGRTGTTSGSGSAKGKEKDPAPKSSAGSKRLLVLSSGSESDSPPQKVAKPKSNATAQASATASSSNRLGRADSEERYQASKVQPQSNVASFSRPMNVKRPAKLAPAHRPPETNNASKPIAPPKPSKKLIPPSDTDSDIDLPLAGKVALAPPLRAKPVKVAARSAQIQDGAVGFFAPRGANPTAKAKIAKKTKAPRPPSPEYETDSDEERMQLPWNLLDATPTEMRRWEADLDKELERAEMKENSIRGNDKGPAPKGSGSMNEPVASGSHWGK